MLFHWAIFFDSVVFKIIIYFFPLFQFSFSDIPVILTLNLLCPLYLSLFSNLLKLYFVNLFSSFPPLFLLDSFVFCFPGGTSGKEPTCQGRRHKTHRLNPWVREICWRRAWQPIPGESHGEKPSGLQCRGSQRFVYNWSSIAHSTSISLIFSFSKFFSLFLILSWVHLLFFSRSCF